MSRLGSVIHGKIGDVIKAKLVPFRDVHLTPYTQGSVKPPSSKTLVFGFAAIAALVLLVAGVNFTNLATARASLRAREVALRKVLGASKRQLVMQFVTEAVLTALLALMLAFAATEAERCRRTAGAWVLVTSIRSRIGAAARLGPATASTITTASRPISFRSTPWEPSVSSRGRPEVLG